MWQHERNAKSRNVHRNLSVFIVYSNVLGHMRKISLISSSTPLCTLERPLQKLFELERKQLRCLSSVFALTRVSYVPIFSSTIPFCNIFMESIRIRKFHISGFMMSTHHSTLGVGENASQQEIKSAYYKLVKRYHPDHNKSPDAMTKFKKIQEAYEALSSGSQEESSSNTNNKRNPYSNDGSEYSEYHGEWSGGADDFIKNFFSNFQNSHASNHVRYQTNVILTFEEAFNGCTKNMRFPIEVACMHCRGSGSEPGTTTTTCSDCNGAGYHETRQASTRFKIMCSRCNGSGNIIKQPCSKCRGAKSTRTETPFEVSFPAGIHHGQTVEFRANKYTTAHINVQIRPHPNFIRIDDDVHSTIDLDVSAAILGAEIKVPLVNGVSTLRIPAGTDSHSKFSFPGKGFRKSNFRAGDHIVHVKIVVPRNPSSDLKNLLKEMSSASPS